MPGPIVHLIVQQRLSDHLRGVNSELPEQEGKALELANLLDEDPRNPYAAFGSIGPDFLFFSMREYGSAIGDFTNFIFDVYDAFEPAIKFYDDNIEPIVDDIKDAIKNVDQALFQGLFGRLQATSDLVNNTLLTAAGVVVTSNIDLFYPFYPKIQQGLSENKWYWFDFLHYRRTGDFASEM